MEADLGAGATRVQEPPTLPRQEQGGCSARENSGEEGLFFWLLADLSAIKDVTHGKLFINL